MPKDEVIYEAECPVCGKIVEFENIGRKICPHCKGAKAEFGISWELIKEKEDA